MALDQNDEPHLSYMEEMSQDVWYATYDPGVGVAPGTPSLAHALRVYPNPAMGGVPVRVEYAGKSIATGPVDLAVYDLSGRRVCSLLAGGAGTGSVQWDGRSDRGTMAAAGTYVVRFEQGGVSTSRRVQLLR